MWNFADFLKPAGSVLERNFAPIDIFLVQRVLAQLADRS